jgi:hypothetical protein
VDEPTEDISPFDVGHTVSLGDGRETLRYPKLQASMRASPVVALDIDPKDAIEMAGAEDQQPVQALCSKDFYPALDADLDLCIGNRNQPLRGTFREHARVGVDELRGRHGHAAAR